VRAQDAAMPLVCVVVVAEAGLSGGLDRAAVAWLERGGWRTHAVPGSSAVRCTPAGPGGLARFALGCAKLHLWSLTGFDQVLYLDADSFARAAGGFDARATLDRFQHVLFAAKPTPPDSKVRIPPCTTVIYSQILLILLRSSFRTQALNSQLSQQIVGAQL
jgi:hypothetical protein